MSKPLQHAQNNVKKYGGKIEDYMPVHELMDISKSGLGDKRHRAVFHNATAIYIIIPKIFGSVLTNSDGKQITTSQIAEDHVLEDFGGKFIPTLQDWLSEIPLKPWMSNGGDEGDYPPSTSSVFKNPDDLDDGNMPVINSGPMPDILRHPNPTPPDNFEDLKRQYMIDNMPIDGASRNRPKRPIHYDLHNIQLD